MITGSNRQTGFTLIELGIAAIILLLAALVVLGILNSQQGTTQPATGTSFTARGDWGSVPSVIGDDPIDTTYDIAISGVSIPGITVRFEIENSAPVFISTTLQNTSTTYDNSGPVTIATTVGEVQTTSAGAVLKMSALDRGTVKVKAIVIDPGGTEHIDPVIKDIEVNNGVQSEYP